MKPLLKRWFLEPGPLRGSTPETKRGKGLELWERSIAKAQALLIMTIKEQLLQTIETLPDDLLAETLKFVQILQHPIHKTPGICGGAARIRDTRIPVWTIVAYQQQGATEAELLYNYPGLTLQDIQAVTNYYESNREEIELWLAENE